MAKKGYTPEQVIRKLREAEVFIAEGMTVGEAARKICVTKQTYYSWKKEYGGMQVLNMEVFDTLFEAKVFVERCRREYNQISPHSFLGYCPPAQEVIVSLWA